VFNGAGLWRRPDLARTVDAASLMSELMSELVSELISEL
jgi:hypothetical protein